MNIVLFSPDIPAGQLRVICTLVRDYTLEQLEKGRTFSKGNFQVTVEAIVTVRASNDREIRVANLGGTGELADNALRNALIKTHKELGGQFAFTVKEPDGDLVLSALR